VGRRVVARAGPEHYERNERRVVIIQLPLVIRAKMP
jgi:hypothetical protein